MENKERIFKPIFKQISDNLDKLKNLLGGDANVKATRLCLRIKVAMLSNFEAFLSDDMDKFGDLIEAVNSLSNMDEDVITLEESKDERVRLLQLMQRDGVISGEDFSAYSAFVEAQEE